MNVMAQDVIDKQHLPIEKHPQPNKVAWVNEVSILVNKRYQITFKIGISEDCVVTPASLSVTLIWLTFTV